MWDHNPDPGWYLAYWSDRIERLLRASVRDRDAVPAAQRVDVHFHEFMADEMGTVSHIYECAGFEFDDSTQQRLADYLATHERGRDGRVVYDLRADFGVEPSAVRAGFDFYFDAFPVPVEVE